MEMDYTDSYGSYTRLITTRHPATGYMEEEMEMAAYDEFGLLTESRSEERSTDPADSPVETDLWVKGERGLHRGGTAAVLHPLGAGGGERQLRPGDAPALRRLRPDGGDSRPGADEAARAPRGYIHRRAPLPDGAVPASGFYIIDGVKTLVR